MGSWFSEVILCAADQMVVSVGPYIFQTELLLRSNCVANSREQASPPHSTLSSGLPFHPASISIRHIAGVACITVALELTSKSQIVGASSISSRLAITVRTPTVSEIGRASCRERG